MEKEMLSKIRKLSVTTQSKGAVNAETLCETVREFACLTGSCVAVINRQGKLVLYYSQQGAKPLFTVKSMGKDEFVEEILAEQLTTVHEMKENATLTGYYLKNVKTAELKKYKSIISPIMAAGERIAVLLAYKETEFTETDIALAEFVTAISALIISENHREETTGKQRKKSVVKAAINSLSYSELEAIGHVFKELDALEGLLVASKIADRVGITRSVIVNALRKFESAGVIESRSLGMKGTYIKVVNEYLLEELNKI